MRLVGANPAAKAKGEEELPGKANYFIGNDPDKWRTNVPTYAKVRYEGVFPGVDLVFYGNQRQLEHDFVVSPGADASRIAFRLGGSKKVSLDAEGNLVIVVEGGELRLQRPLIYQDGSGGRRDIPGGYLLKGAREVAFIVDAYDHTKPLVIDPVLAYSTYLGGSSEDSGNCISVDSSGNAYVAGTTYSTNFPTTRGAFQTSLAGVANVFITKLNPGGSGLVYSTYLGGSGGDGALGIAVDSSGNAYVTGSTESSDFPTTAGAFQTTFGGGNFHVFVTKLNPTGTALAYSTYLGGSYAEEGNSIAVDSSGDAYVIGSTASSNFPTTAGAFQTSLMSTGSTFVTKLNRSGSALVYSTFLEGSGGSSPLAPGNSIAVDSSGNAYVIGIAESADFPTIPGAFQTTYSGGWENPFVTKLNPAGTALVYSTFLGGDTDLGVGIAVDSSGNAYLTGSTNSNDFPTTVGAFQTSRAGGADAFVTKLNPSGSTLVYSTYLGGNNFDSGSGIAIDPLGNAYVAGYTSSTSFPTTAGAFQTSLAGAGNAFVTVLNPSGTALVYSTYLGGNNSDGGRGIAIDSLGNAYVAGSTSSSNFPTTARAFQTSLAGTYNAFVAKFENTPQAQVTNLQSTVKNLVSTGTLNAGLGQFLLAPLNAALAAANAGRTGAAVRDLDAFIIDIRFLVIIRQLTPTEGQTLINAANSLIAELRG
jgi:hypothetical protein